MSDPGRGQKLGKNHNISPSLQKPTFEALDETCSTIHSTTSTKKQGRVYMPLDHSTLRYPMFNAPDMLQEWFHWVIQPANFEESEPCLFV